MTRPRGIERLQWLDGTATKTELAVVVVLHDRGVVPLGPGQQRQSSLEGHRHAERVLVRRSHVDETGVAGQRVDHESMSIHRHGSHTGTE
jgi:hypothetical protein